MPTYRYVFADVFTDTPLTGNQLAVFTDARGLDAGTMQALALEIGFSETVFVLPPEQGGTARIRIFNPAYEMKFAGHPTLGAAFVLGAPLQRGVIEPRRARDRPRRARADESGRIVFGRMTQPLPRVEEVETRTEVLAAIGAQRSTLPVELYDNGARHIVVTLDGAAELGTLVRDGAAIGARDHRRQRDRAQRERLAEPDALGTRRGPGHRLRRRADRLPPRAPRADRMGRRDRDRAGRRDGTPVDAPRADGGDGLIDAVEVGGAAVIVARGEFRLLVPALRRGQRLAQPPRARRPTGAARSA